MFRFSAFIDICRRGGARFRLGLAAALCAIAAVALPSCVTDEVKEPWSVGSGDECPRFDIVLDDGSRVATADLAGRRTMIVFFNTGCEDCRRELPVIQSVADRLGQETAGGPGQDSGIPYIICVSRGEGSAAVGEYWAANGLTLPYSAQDDNAVYRRFADSVIPREYIIGADLRIVAAYAERLPSADELLRQMGQ